MTIPDDDPARTMAVVHPDDPACRCISVSGSTYTILLSGRETAGRYCLLDMEVPHCGGPGPHRHDFEEMFTVLEGEIRFTFRGEESVIKAGTTVNIPANAPHFFTNVSGARSRMICMCTPAGLEDFFLAFGDPVAGRTAPPPALTGEDKAARIARAAELAPRYRIELVPP